MNQHPSPNDRTRAAIIVVFAILIVLFSYAWNTFGPRVLSGLNLHEEHAGILLWPFGKSILGVSGMLDPFAIGGLVLGLFKLGMALGIVGLVRWRRGGPEWDTVGLGIAHPFRHRWLQWIPWPRFTSSLERVDWEILGFLSLAFSLALFFELVRDDYITRSLQPLRILAIPYLVLTLFVAYFYSFLGAALPEEFIFRGMLQTHLVTLWSAIVEPPKAGILSVVSASLLFGISHFTQYWPSSHPIEAAMRGILREGSVGLLLGYLWYKRNKLRLPVLVHALLNAWVVEFTWLRKTGSNTDIIAKLLAVSFAIVIFIFLVRALIRSRLVNVNTATFAQLQTLPRIGTKRAQAIVRHRKEKGPFKTPEDIMAVRGIGPKTFDEIKPHITVDEPEEEDHVEDRQPEA